MHFTLFFWKRMIMTFEWEGPCFVAAVHKNIGYLTILLQTIAICIFQYNVQPYYTVYKHTQTQSVHGNFFNRF